MKKKKTKTKTQTQTQTKKDSPIGPYAVGDKVVIRAIPFHYIGEIEAFGEKAVTLKDAGWLADSARWSEAFLKRGEINEYEPYPDGVSIQYQVIADTTLWRHALPREPK